MAARKTHVPLLFFVGLNLGLLCAATVVAVGRTLEPRAGERVFFLAKWVSGLLAGWLEDSNEITQYLIGLAVQHVTSSLAVAVFCLFALLFLRVEEALLKRLGWFLAASNPWFVLAVVAETRSGGGALMGYSWIALCLGVTLRVAWVARKSLYKPPPEAMVLFLAVLASWFFMTTFLGPVERIAAYLSLLAAIGLGALSGSAKGLGAGDRGRFSGPNSDQRRFQ